MAISKLRQQLMISKWLLSGMVICAILIYLFLQPSPSNTAFVVVSLFINIAVIYSGLAYIERQFAAYELTANQRDDRQKLMVSLVHSAVDAVIQLDLNGCVQSWNPGAGSLFGYYEATIRGQSFAVLLGDGDAARLENQWLINSVRQEGSVIQHETMCRNQNGRLIDVDLTASLIRGEDGNILGISLVLRDISRRKSYENEVERQYSHLAAQSARHAQELSEKIAQLAEVNNELRQLDQTRSEFVSLVSHQIRAPLTNMVGAIQRMRTSCMVTTPTCNRMFAIFEQQVNQLERLVQDVLNLTRIEQSGALVHLEPTSISPVARQAIQQIEMRSTTHCIHFTDKPGLPLIYADRDRVVEVLTNLLDNAYKYAGDEKPIFVDIRADQNEVTVSVRDSGQGLPDTDLERVFEKFYRVDNSDSQTAYGYGLGLYLCRRLIEAQKGRIWAENHPDGGAIFSFALPVWEE